MIFFRCEEPTGASLTGSPGDEIRRVQRKSIIYTEPYNSPHRAPQSPKPTHHRTPKIFFITG
jgi:hypothetical protein